MPLLVSPAARSVIGRNIATDPEHAPPSPSASAEAPARKRTTVEDASIIPPSKPKRRRVSAEAREAQRRADRLDATATACRPGRRSTP